MIDHLECTACAAEWPADRLWNVCASCDGPLVARYDLAAIGARWKPADLVGRPPGVWRWREVLPVGADEAPVSLGEGGTPLVPSRAIGPSLGLSRLAFKDETRNPTLSFKARGLAVAIHRARSLGADRVALPSAGNAGSAAAAYAAVTGMGCYVAMPASTPATIMAECRAFGATVELVDGTISDAARWIRERAWREGWFEVSTLREPYRVEGKKTMGYELAEDHGWSLPDAIVYPTGGGTGLIGMWKAFDELEALGWGDARRPRMIAVQADGCAPLVRAFEAGAERAEPVADPRTVAHGLRVPATSGDFLLLSILRASGGVATAVDDASILAGARRLAREEGLLAGPEAGATVAALPGLIEDGVVAPDDRVVCLATGHGLKYPEVLGLDRAGARPGG